MIDREKVIRGLECCIVQTEEFPPLCEECPYCDEKIGSCEYYRDILSDALALLKAQEPRVLTLNEANAAMQKDDVIWIEKKGDPVYGGLKKQDYFEMQDDSITDFDDLMEPKIADAYGNVFRLWSSKPTDEQREAVPWQE